MTSEEIDEYGKTIASKTTTNPEPEDDGARLTVGGIIPPTDRNTGKTLRARRAGRDRYRDHIRPGRRPARNSAR